MTCPPQTRHLEYWEYATRQFVAFAKAAHRVAVERPDLHVVVRPHPSEDPAAYERILGGLPNATVTREHAVGAWILAAEAVVQHGCTTALESVLADKPVERPHTQAEGCIVTIPIPPGKTRI
ncbi:MAG: hypothetical protein HC822_03495 [Oscillochloris sp.]|nr:hypothetical protein [Oscillochloris sp.]